FVRSTSDMTCGGAVARKSAKRDLLARLCQASQGASSKNGRAGLVASGGWVLYGGPCRVPRLCLWGVCLLCGALPVGRTAPGKDGATNARHSARWIDSHGLKPALRT